MQRWNFGPHDARTRGPRIAGPSDGAEPLMAETLLNTLRSERDRLGLTQAALAERCGVSRKTINTVENGVFVPSTILALKLAAALDRPVEALFRIEPTP
jgi:putative transcriptional regulator